MYLRRLLFAVPPALKKVIVKVRVDIRCAERETTALLVSSHGIEVRSDKLEVSCFHILLRLEHGPHDFAFDVDITLSNLPAIITLSICIWLRS